MMERVLIFRPDNIGDIVLFSGVVRHLRAVHSKAHITLAVQPHAINLIEFCPYADKIISVDELVTWRKLQRKAVRGSFRFAGTLKAFERMRDYVAPSFDRVIYPVKSPQPKHLEVVADLHLRKVVGMHGCHINEPEGGYPEDLRPEKLYSDRLDVSRCDPWRHELFTYVDFLGFLGIRAATMEDVRPEVWIPDSERNLLKEESRRSGKLVGIFPCATDERRCWNPENYTAVARSLDRDVVYVLFGSQRDLKLSSHVERALIAGRPGARIINLAARTTLRELYVAISTCSVLLSMDSAGLHMGIAAGIPTVAVAGGGHFGRFIPWGDPAKNVVLSQKLDCFHCNWKCHRETADCIQGVRPDEVTSAIRTVMAKSKEHSL